MLVNFKDYKYRGAYRVHGINLINDTVTILKNREYVNVSLVKVKKFIAEMGDDIIAVRNYNSIMLNSVRFRTFGKDWERIESLFDQANKI